jgi:hypothetical protein
MTICQPILPIHSITHDLGLARDRIAYVSMPWSIESIHDSRVCSDDFLLFLSNRPGDDDNYTDTTTPRSGYGNLLQSSYDTLSSGIVKRQFNSWMCEVQSKDQNNLNAQKIACNLSTRSKIKGNSTLSQKGYSYICHINHHRK